MTATTVAASDREWRIGWSLVLAAGVGGSIVSFYSAALGALMKPIAAATGWSRGEISLSAIIVNVGILLVSPFVGRLADRIGARPVVLAGVCLYSLALACIGLSGGSIWTWYLAWLFVALTIPIIEPTTWTIPVCDHFRRHRGLALGLSTCGIGVAITIVPLIAVMASSALGWKLTYVLLGSMAWLAAFPLAWLFFHDARGRAAKQGLAPPIEAPKSGLTVPQVIAGYRFWVIVVVMLLCSLGPGALYVHFQPMMSDIGFTPAAAAALAGVIGPSSILGRILGGWLLDRVFAGYAGLALFAVLVLGCVLMLPYAQSLPLAVLLAFGVGLSLGIEVDLCGYLVSRYFGLKSYGALYGAIFGVFCLGFGCSAYLAGAVFDASGSYRPLLMGVAVVTSLAALLLLTLGRYPVFAEAPQDVLAPTPAG